MRKLVLVCGAIALMSLLSCGNKAAKEEVENTADTTVVDTMTVDSLTVDTLQVDTLKR